jgi:hypothetical protein
VKKNAEVFLIKTLGDNFLESLSISLSKSEIFKPGTRSITDTNDMYQGLQIVPRTMLNLLVRELSPMQIGDTKEISIPGQEKTIVSITKNERDQFSGQIFQNNVKINDFINRSIPGLGLVLMSVLQLYSMDDLEQDSIPQDKQSEINRIIDERLNLHSLVNKVVDGRIQQKDAIQQLLMARLTEEFAKEKAAAQPVEAPKPPVVIILDHKKSRPLSEFVENRKKKLGKKEFSIEMTKSEIVDCPDCGQNIFNKSGISACLCYGQDMGRKVFLKKTEDGIKVSFPKSWSPENIEMLLEVLRRKNG